MSTKHTQRKRGAPKKRVTKVRQNISINPEVLKLLGIAARNLLFV